MGKLQPHEIQLAIQFSERLADPELWINMADELLAAAGILQVEVLQYWSEVQVEGVRVVSASLRKNVQGAYFLLIAYVLENYFKALLVHKNRQTLRNRLLIRIPNYVKQHDLLQLASEVGIKLTVVEEDLLCRLSRNSIWAGRYPVPTGPTSISAIRQFSNGKTYLVAYFHPADVERVNDFVDRLREYITAEIGILHNKAPNSAG